MIGQTAMFAPDPTEPLRKRVTVELVPTSYARHALETFHYLHRTRTGRQLNYAVYIDGVIDGVITYAYPMMIAPLDGVPCARIVEFARLYLHTNIPHTATCAIAKTLKRIRSDWSSRFHDAEIIEVIVSWSDATRHTGTIYRAANFTHLHRSKPGKKSSSAWPQKVDRSDFEHEKDCWIYRWTN